MAHPLWPSGFAQSHSARSCTREGGDGGGIQDTKHLEEENGDENKNILKRTSMPSMTGTMVRAKGSA